MENIALLEIIYGECVKPIFESYAFVWDVEENKKKKLEHSLNGKIVTLDGKPVLNEIIDDIVPLKDKAGKIQAYIVFINGKLDKYYKILPGIIINEEILSIVSDKTFDYLPIKATFYSVNRPEIIVEYNFKVYIPRFSGAKIEYFESII